MKAKGLSALLCVVCITPLSCAKRSPYVHIASFPSRHRAPKGKWPGDAFTRAFIESGLPLCPIVCSYGCSMSVHRRDAREARKIIVDTIRRDGLKGVCLCPGWRRRLSLCFCSSRY